MHLSQILIQPIVTEKTSRDTENGRYTFLVNKGATKIDIKNAFRSMYGIHAVAVTIRNTVEKIRVVGKGKTIIKRASVKKATVAVTPGTKVDLFKFTSEKKEKVKTVAKPKAKKVAAAAA